MMALECIDTNNFAGQLIAQLVLFLQGFKALHCFDQTGRLRAHDHEKSMVLFRKRPGLVALDDKHRHNVGSAFASVFGMVLVRNSGLQQHQGNINGRSCASIKRQIKRRIGIVVNHFRMRLECDFLKDRLHQCDLRRFAEQIASFFRPDVQQFLLIIDQSDQSVGCINRLQTKVKDTLQDLIEVCHCMELKNQWVKRRKAPVSPYGGLILRIHRSPLHLVRDPECSSC